MWECIDLVNGWLCEGGVKGVKGVFYSLKKRLKFFIKARPILLLLFKKSYEEIYVTVYYIN